jgi:hypothetical protein
LGRDFPGAAPGAAAFAQEGLQGSIAMLRNEALQSHVACGAVQVRSDRASLKRIDKDAIRPAALNSRSRLALRIDKRQGILMSATHAVSYYYTH